MAAMMRSLSSCLEVTRMWRRTERASLEATLDEIEPGAVLGREDEFESTGRLLGEPSLGLLGDVRRMIVEDQLDRCVGRVRGVEELEDLNEFAAAVAVLDEGVDLASEQIDAGQQADRSVALVLGVAREGRRSAGLGRQVRGGRGDCLNAGLLIVGDNRHRIAVLVLRPPPSP